MRTWLWYRTNGEIGGAERCVPGGWPTHIDFNNPANVDPAVQNIRALRLPVAGFAGFLAFDCECDGDICACGSNLVGTHYIHAGVLNAKPVYEIRVDGVAVAPGTRIDRAPNADVTVSLSGMLPDGVVIDLMEPPGAPLAILPVNPSPLTFSVGNTNAVVFPAPPRLSVARLVLRPRDARSGAVSSIQVRGW